jgi:hypothetical protein
MHPAGYLTSGVGCKTPGKNPATMKTALSVNQTGLPTQWLLSNFAGVDPSMITITSVSGVR